MSDGDSETQSDRETHETDDTQDVPPLAASVKTLQEAVQLSIAAGFSKKSLFIFSRALRAFEITNKRRLSADEVKGAFSLWWQTARPSLPPDADFDEFRFVFMDTFGKTKVALGANPMDEAIRRADSMPPPPQATRYPSRGLKRLVSTCVHLGTLAGDSTFFLSVRDAARILRTKDRNKASAMLAGLVQDGVLILIEKGKSGGKRASRFRISRPAPGAS
jgi:hypothetical protein